MHFEYHLPLSTPRPGFSWSHGSWGDCSATCGGGEGRALVGGAAARGAWLSPPGAPAVGGGWTRRGDSLMSWGSPGGNPEIRGLEEGPPPNLREPEGFPEAVASHRRQYSIGSGGWAWS